MVCLCIYVISKKKYNDNLKINIKEYKVLEFLNIHQIEIIRK